MSDQYIGEIRMVGFNFAPNGWAICAGQTLAISQNAALFSLLGTTYGGNGTSTFQLPDLQGRVPINAGSGAGLPVYIIGQQGGQANATLAAGNLPIHTHAVAHPASTSNATSSNPSGAYPAVTVTTTNDRNVTATTASYAASPTTGVTEASFPSGPAGSNLPFSIEPPYLAVNFIIALTGIFPSRN
jgi:microcystin-dependent protein